MGRGKEWQPEEKAHLAEAWLAIAEDRGQPKVKGTSQESDAFWKRIFDLFSAKKPSNSPECNKKHGARGVSAMKSHWLDDVARDIRAFNEALLLVEAAKLSGPAAAEKVNIAVAVHVGKTDVPSSRHRDFCPEDWKNCQACLIVKHNPGFIPSRPKVAVELSDSDDDDVMMNSNNIPIATEDLNNESNSYNNDSSESDVAAVAGSLTKKQKRQSGGDPGRNSTRKKAALDECQSEKLQLKKDALECQEKRRRDFHDFVANDARTQAFQMASCMFDVNKGTGRMCDVGLGITMEGCWAEQMQKIVMGDTPQDLLNDAIADGEQV